MLSSKKIMDGVTRLTIQELLTTVLGTPQALPYPYYSKGGFHLAQVALPRGRIEAYRRDKSYVQALHGLKYFF